MSFLLYKPFKLSLSILFVMSVFSGCEILVMAPSNGSNYSEQDLLGTWHCSSISSRMNNGRQQEIVHTRHETLQSNGRYTSNGKMRLKFGTAQYNFSVKGSGDWSFNFGKISQNLNQVSIHAINGGSQASALASALELQMLEKKEAKKFTPQWISPKHFKGKIIQQSGTEVFVECKQ